MWLCNHCPDYLSPDSSASFVGTSIHGTQEHAFKHVQTAYVRFDSAPMLVPPKICFLRHNIDHPLVDVDLFLYPDLGVDWLTP